MFLQANYFIQAVRLGLPIFFYWLDVERCYPHREYGGKGNDLCVFVLYTVYAVLQVRQGGSGGGSKQRE